MDALIIQFLPYARTEDLDLLGLPPEHSGKEPHSDGGQTFA